MSCLRDLDSISWLSLVGMGCLVAGVAAILLHGARAFGSEAVDEYFGDSGGSDSQAGAHIREAAALWPSTLDGAAAFLGVIIFCFDICSLAFPIEQSMRRKENFGKAVVWALLFVWAVYVVLGDVGAVLYVHDPQGIQENILGNLPLRSTVALMVRCAMACVSPCCARSFPLVR
jgi:amino acid permease